MIDAMTVRYVEHFDPNTRVEQDRAYAEAMRKLAETYADDLDIVTLYGDALFLLEPRRGSRDGRSVRARGFGQRVAGAVCVLVVGGVAAAISLVLAALAAG